MAIELSPIIAQTLRRRRGAMASRGLWIFAPTLGARCICVRAQFLAAVINAAPRSEHVLWGLDREVTTNLPFNLKLDARVRGAEGGFTRA